MRLHPGQPPPWAETLLFLAPHWSPAEGLSNLDGLGAVTPEVLIGGGVDAGQPFRYNMGSPL